MQLGFIKQCIKIMNKEQLEGLRGVVDPYPNDEYKQKIVEMIKEKYDKNRWIY